MRNSPFFRFRLERFVTRWMLPVLLLGWAADAYRAGFPQPARAGGPMANAR